MNRTTKNYALFISTKIEQPDPLWLSSKAHIGKNKKLNNTRSHAMNGSNLMRMGSVDDYLFQTEKSKSRRSNANEPNRNSMEVNLTESIEGHDLGVIKSAVLRKRKSETLDKKVMSPQIGAEEESIDMDDEEVEKYRIPSRNSEEMHE